MATDGSLESGAERLQHDAAREPFIKGKRCKESTTMVWTSTTVAVCGSFVFGTCVGYSAPTQSMIREDLDLTLAEFSVFGSVLTIGAMIGAITSGPKSDFLGRKGAMRVSSVICIVGWLAIYFAQEAMLLDLGRFITGYGIGTFSYVVPVFIAEIAPKRLRGGLTTINQLLICSGLSAALIVGTFVSWRNLALIGVVPCFALLLGLMFIPESPRWLAKVGHEKEFKIALQILRGRDADITEEAADIQEYIKESNRLPEISILDLFDKTYIRPVIVGVGLMVFQQFGGINGIFFYASETFVSAGFSSGSLGTILTGSVQVPITALGAFLMDRSGRRPLLMISATGTFVGSLLTALSFYFKGQGDHTNLVPALALSGILVYVGSFSLGMGGIPWVIMSEVFPINIKGVAGSLVTLVNWFSSWAVTFVFNFLMEWSSSGTFFIFTAICATAVLFIAKIVPETKGRTLEEIQASMK